MQINPISFTNNIYLPQKHQKKANTISKEINLNYMNYAKPPINFRGGKNVSLDLVQKLPLCDRLASLFEHFKLGDLILVGKDISEAKKSIYDNASLIKNVIKRAFFIPDETIEGYAAFFKNLNNDTEVINLNKKDIFLITDNKTYPLKPNESFYILPGDTLLIEGNPLKIKDKPKTDLSGFRKNFSKAFDFGTDAEAEIQRINKKTISQLSKEIKKTPSQVTFKDVGGQDKLIDELKKSILYPIRYPEGYENMDVNHGFILYGPPGTGKTHIARALSNEADAHFISLNGLELESKWVGESEENWRKLFDEAKSKQPSIIFIDELDAVAKNRSGKDTYGDKVVNQILTLMSDLDNNADNVFVIGATNNFESLDGAITRSGRFSKHIEVKLPDLEGTRKIFEIHAQNKQIDENVSQEEIIKRLFDLKASGADIKYIINEAHSNGYQRAGIFDKMENKTLKTADLKNFRITKEDFDKTIKEFVESRDSKERKPIGFAR